MTWIVAVGLVLLIAIAIYDLTQRQHAILRTFPIIGHFRYWLEARRSRAPSVHRHRQQRGASIQPRPAAMDLRVGETREQLLRVWFRQRDGAATELPDHQARHLSAGGPSSWRSGVRSAVPDSMRESDGRSPAETACISAGIDRQRVGNELWVAERASRGGAQSRQPDCRLPAEHGRRRRFVAPPEGRRSRVASRHRLLRLS